MVSLRQRVKDAPRDFCCTGHSKSDCHKPQYPKDGDVGCRSFRCTRCKSTVGWCRGVDHGEDEVFKTSKKSNGWCDDCWCEVYADPRKLLLEEFLNVQWVSEVECEEYGLVPAIMISTPGNSDFRPSKSEKEFVINKVRKLGINYPIYYTASEGPGVQAGDE